MEFHRIGKNVVQCHMTLEEMSEYGLEIEDFFTNQDKCKAFLEQLVEMAEEEIGYEASGGMISMQLMRMPDDTLVITFSDKTEDSIQNMINNLQEMVQSASKNGIQFGDNDSVDDEISAAIENDSVDMGEFEERVRNGAEKSIKKKSKKITNFVKLYKFDNLSDIEDFAKAYPMKKNISSKLYKDQKTGVWYLLVKKGKLRQEEYQKLCDQLTEYAGNPIIKPYVEQFCKEHYISVIGKQALKTLKEYVD